MFYSSQAEELRLYPRQVGFSGTDVGNGWLIFEESRSRSQPKTTASAG